jgi:hypothetical protein
MLRHPGTLGLVSAVYAGIQGIYSAYLQASSPIPE